eukprot:1152566-Prorocentrum_minimum.AAC.1
MIYTAQSSRFKHANMSCRYIFETTLDHLTRKRRRGDISLWPGADPPPPAPAGTACTPWPNCARTPAVDLPAAAASHGGGGAAPPAVPPVGPPPHWLPAHPPPPSPVWATPYLFIYILNITLSSTKHTDPLTPFRPC